jgi:hypothetical protein
MGAGSASPVVSTMMRRKKGISLAAALIEAPQRRHQIAADRAAEAAAGEQHHILARRFHQQVIEADLAELIDDDGGLGIGGIAQKLAQQGGLAAAKEAGQDRDR